MPQAVSSDSLIPRAANNSAAPMRQSLASEPPPLTDPDTPVETPPPPPVQEPAETLADASGADAPGANAPGAEAPGAEAPGNVLPFRPPGDARPPALTPVENSAFNELARQLSARLDNDTATPAPVAEAPLKDEVLGWSPSPSPKW